jgi:UTP--glucose-1-phosphate uridylyltransferase
MDMEVRRAVIPVAGMGTRFLPATKAQPKEMLPLIDRPAIQFVVEEVSGCGIRDILLVTGRHKRAIEDHFDLSPELEQELRRRGRMDLARVVSHAASLADIQYVRQKQPLGLGDAVRCGERFAANEPVAVLLADDVIDARPSCLSQMLEVFRREHCSVVAVEEVAAAEVGRYGIVKPDGPVTGDTFACADIVEKPSPADAPSRLAVVGRYILTPDVFQHLRDLRPGAGGELQLTDALAAMARAGRVVAYRYRGCRWDTGDPAGLLKASIRYALSRPDLRADILAFMRQLLDDSAQADAASATAGAG